MKRKVMKMEIWKSVHNRMFLAAMMINLMFVLLDFLENLKSIHQCIPFLPAHGGYEGISLYVRWIGINMETVGYSLFFSLLPLTASLPYGWSHSEEHKSGYCNHILTVERKRTYFNAKYVAVFFSGGLVVALPLLISLICEALICPVSSVSITSFCTSIGEGYFLPELYYRNPFIYLLISIFLDFLWGGVSAGLSFMAGYFLKQKIFVILFPFLLFWGTEFAIEVLRRPVTYMRLETSPLRLMHIQTVNMNPWWLVAGMILFFGLIPFVVCCVRERKNDI